MKGLRGLVFSGSSRLVVKALENNSHSRYRPDPLQVSAYKVTFYCILKHSYWCVEGLLSDALRVGG